MVSNFNFARLGFTPSAVENTPIPFGEWLPDLPEVNNPGAVEALNVIPSEQCYVPFKDLALQPGLTLPSAARGGVMIFDRAGSPQLFIGTPTGIYQRVGSAFVQVYTPAMPLYDGYKWQFVQFGWSLVALHPQVSPQVADVGGVVSFSPLGGTPPIARCASRVGDFVVLGNLDNENDPDSPRQPQRIRWSAFNNIESPWVTDPATQADFNDMPVEGGAVMNITGREYGTIFQERSISRMSYVGLPTVFDIETVEEERGAIATGSVVDIGAYVYFIAEDGFHVWNGTNATPIGDNKVNRYFFTRLNYAARDRIVGAVDYVNKCIVWAFPVGSSTDLTELIIYSYKENRFTHALKAVDHIMNGYSLDASLDDMFLNLDTQYPISFDDGSFAGGRPYLAGIETATHAFGLFNGSNMAATIDTAEFTGPSGNRVFVNSVRPLVDTPTPSTTVQIAKRDQLMGEALVFDTAIAQEITGECPVLDDARYMRFRIAVAAGVVWNQAMGIEVWRKATGRR